MKIGIGNIGGAPAHRLSAAGHRVGVANSKGAEAVRSLAILISR
ncbi:NAD(P)-binding domain-containing protein [Rhizorhabdus argentea]